MPAGTTWPDRDTKSLRWDSTESHGKDFSVKGYVMKLNYLELVLLLEELTTDEQFIGGTSQLEYASICTAVKSLRTYEDWGNDVSCVEVDTCSLS
jgi:hypothetical protein